MATSNKTKEQKAQYMRDYRARNPEYSKAQWEQSAVRTLKRKGYIVIGPNEQDALRKAVNEIFPSDYHSGDPAIGQQLLAEALFLAKEAKEQAAEAEKAAKAKGLEVIGLVDMLPTEGGETL